MSPEFGSTAAIFPIDEGHLNVELGELRLAVSAEVLVDQDDVIALAEEIVSALWKLIGYEITTPIPRMAQ